jgi:nitroreductase
MEDCDMLREAACGVLVCGDPRLEKFPGFWVQDCSACTQNVLLAAHARGLGAVWIAIHPLDDRSAAVRRLLGIPEEIVPFALVSIGYPAEHLGGEDRFDSERVHYESWQP